MDEWLDRWPRADWAIRHTETVVLDIEMKNGLNGEKDLAEICACLPKTTAVKTKSGGRHLWYRAPAGCTNYSTHIAAGVEAKFSNATAHCPPSMGYEWIEGPRSPADLPVLPKECLEAWNNAIRTRPVAQYQKIMYHEGERHHMLCAMAKALRQAGLVESELVAALTAVKNNRCVGVFEDTAVRDIALSYCKHPIGSPELAAMAGDVNAAYVCALIDRMCQ